MCVEEGYSRVVRWCVRRIASQAQASQAHGADGKEVWRLRVRTSEQRRHGATTHHTLDTLVAARSTHQLRGWAGSCAQRPTCPRAMNCTQVRVVALRLHPSSTLCPTHDHACAATGGAARTSGIATPVLKQLRWLRKRCGAISVSRCRTQKVPTSKNGRVSQATGDKQLAARSAALRECCDAGPQRCDRMSHHRVAPPFTVSHHRSHVGLPKKCLARKN